MFLCVYTVVVMGWVWCCLLLVMRVKSRMKGKEREFMLVVRAERGELSRMHVKRQKWKATYAVSHDEATEGWRLWR